MANGTIPIPWSLRYRRWRDTFVPVVAFVLCAAATAWLWDRHTGSAMVYGEVEAVRVDLASAVEGVLMPLPGGAPGRFDFVAAGQIIARLDDRPTLAALATLQRRVAQSRSEVAAMGASMAMQRADVHRAGAIDLAELILNIQQQRLDIVDRRGEIEVNRVDLQRLVEEYEHIRRMHEQNAETDFTLTMASLRRDVLAKRVAEQEDALRDAQRQLEESEAALAQLPATLNGDIEAMLQPLRHAVYVLEAEVSELELAVESLMIRAPFAGEIAAVHAVPGQAIVPGMPIVTIADPHSRSVVVYFRERAMAWPEPGMKVAVYSIRDRSVVHESTILRVGSQVTLLPERHRADALVPEWGLPVRVALPAELSLRPGEMVGVLMQ